MSQWTHVNGSIRYDAGYRNPKKEELKKLIGIMANYGDADSFEKCNMPCGSEGSIEYNIYENENLNDLAAFVVSIWGDLRDYNNSKEIEEWFHKITKDQFIRSAILEIDVEYENTIILQYDERNGINKIELERLRNEKDNRI